MQGIILSSFYWGYALSHFPGGLLVQSYGGKYVLALSILFSGIISCVMPVCVQYGVVRIANLVNQFRLLASLVARS